MVRITLRESLILCFPLLLLQPSRHAWEKKLEEKARENKETATESQENQAKPKTYCPKAKLPALLLQRPNAIGCDNLGELEPKRTPRKGEETASAFRENYLVAAPTGSSRNLGESRGLCLRQNSQCLDHRSL